MAVPPSPARKAETQQPTLYALTIVFTVLALASVCLRLYTRKQILRIVGADDIVIIVAQVLSLGVTATTVAQAAAGGLGTHVEFVTPERFLAGAKGFYSNLLVYNAAQLATKISFLLQYRRLFPAAIIKKACLCGMVFLTFWGVTQQFITAFSCVPLAFIIPKWLNRCIPTFIIFNVNAIVNILTDFMIFLIPCQPVFNLTMSIRQKVYLLMVFSLGFFACSISIVRLHELHRTKNTSDPTWDSTAASYWSVVELNVGILCACLPTLRPLIRAFIPRLLNSLTNKDSHSHGPSAINLSIRRRNDIGVAIYIHKESEFQSTTDLRASGTGKVICPAGGYSQERW